MATGGKSCDRCISYFLAAFSQTFHNYKLLIPRCFETGSTSKLEDAALTKSSLSQFYKDEESWNIDFLKAPEKGYLFVIVLK